jgi:hypothetical protein
MSFNICRATLGSLHANTIGAKCRLIRGRRKWKDRHLSSQFQSRGRRCGQKSNVKRHIHNFALRGTFLPLDELLSVSSRFRSLKCRRIKTKTISRTSRAVAASKSPISRISSLARSRARVDNKAVNRADSRTDNQSAPFCPQHRCWGLFNVVDPVTVAMSASASTP